TTVGFIVDEGPGAHDHRGAVFVLEAPAGRGIGDDQESVLAKGKASHDLAEGTHDRLGVSREPRYSGVAARGRREDVVKTNTVDVEANDLRLTHEQGSVGQRVVARREPMAPEVVETGVDLPARRALADAQIDRVLGRKPRSILEVHEDAGPRSEEH